MAVTTCLDFNFSTNTLSSSSSASFLSRIHFLGEKSGVGGRRGSRRSINSSFVALSTHSNPKILKSNRRSRFGQRLSPYDSDDDGDDGGGVGFDVDSDDEFPEDSSPWDDEFAEIEEFSVESQSFQSDDETNTKQGDRRQPKREWDNQSLKSRQGLKVMGSRFDTGNRKNTQVNRNYRDASNGMKEIDSIDIDGRGKMKSGKSTEGKYRQLSDELDLDKKWYPLLDYLSTFGLKESHFIQIYERHMPSLQINVASAQERLEYLLSVGVKHRDIRKMLLRQPQILEYTVDNLKSHVSFLLGLGVPDSRIGQIIAAAPSLFSYSVEHSLKPTVRYLVEEVGIKRADLTKVLQLSPQILVQRIDSSWNARLGFLSKELGAPRDCIVKMVTKHPQLLHYSIEDGILPRINFLRSIGMRNSDILKVLTSLTQVLSLSLEKNLKPKYSYLVNELQNEVKSLTKYPTYLSLSLDQRIRPRHQFLVALRKAPEGPFPLSSFVPTDESFCHQWAGTSLDKYLAFRQSLLLKEFAKKYQKKR
ncbi:transcription termination factor MTERF9, chloroplastic [Macadamia integrifolia]|uniref:transcription termination factor MTERF9, chloroplastic n=1 Tax=Macadamia integrifolia TaxID=60698 RepID=UPI001C4E83D6|nr:transcription termination factor MTERF9, chloroplastic [Macadamia integrifolia]